MKQLRLPFHPLLSIVLVLSAVFLINPIFGVSAADTNVSVQLGDSVRVGSQLLVPAGTINNGDAVAIMDDVIIDGELRGDAVAVGGDVRVNGRVDGDVVGVGGEVSLGDNAEITGSVTVVGAGLDRSRSARVHGSVNNVSVGQLFNGGNFNFGGWRRWLSLENPISYLFYLAGLFALALLTITLLPNHVANIGNMMEKDWSRSALIGFLTLLLIGPASLIIAVTVIGIPLAFLLWVGFFLAKALGYVAFVSLLGLRLTKTSELSPVARLAIGVLILGLVRYVPFIGSLVSFVVTIITLGAVVDSRFGTNKPWLPPRQSA